MTVLDNVQPVNWQGRVTDQENERHEGSGHLHPGDEFIPRERRREEE